MATSLDDKVLRGQQLKTYTSYVKRAINDAKSAALAADSDENVKQSPVTGGTHPLLVTSSASPTGTVTEGAGYVSGISIDAANSKINIGSGTISATEYSGKATTAGTADTAKTLSSDVTPSVSVVAGTATAAPKVSVKVGNSGTGTSGELTKASTSAFGVVKLDSTIGASTSETTAPTTKAVADALSNLDAANINYSGDKADVEAALDDLYDKIGGGDGDSLSDRIDALESGKQDTLISGTNIKTVDGQSIVGSGNINSKYVDQVPVSDNHTYPLLLAGFNIDSSFPTSTQSGKSANVSMDVTFNPSTKTIKIGGSGTLTATAYSGKANTAGTADKAVADANGLDIATNYALKSELLLPTPVIATSLPATVSDDHKGKFVFVKDSGASTDERNVFTEYIAVEESAGSWKYERIGSTTVNLDIDYLTNDDVNSIWESTAAAS